MKRLKYLFAGYLLLATLPTWRLLDLANVTLPFPILISVAITVWSLFFVALPLKLLIQKMNRWTFFLISLALGSLAWVAGPFSNQTILEPDLTHCGKMSYSGFFHPIRGFLTSAHQDDLEIRNQMCWVVKMIKKVPAQIAPEDLANHLNLMKAKLLKPMHKYRATLPWITFLLGKYLTSSEIKNSAMLIQNLGFWSQLYSEEISGRDYSWQDWPHSLLIKFEYGLIEKNWEKIRIEIIK